LINEFEDVILRDKFRKYFSISAAINLKKNIQILGTKVSTTSSINICRDPKDNFLLDLAVDGAADYLITGDKDLLILQQIDKCKIVTWQRFNEIVSQ
jgi:putative PIN family toxin of toxin-antitoxin system